MSMICLLLGVSTAQIAAFERAPALAGDAANVASDDAHKARMAPYLAAMTPEQRRAREEEERKNRKAFPEIERAEARLSEARDRLTPIGPFEKALSLEKSWHMLHYLMTGHGWDIIRDMENGRVAAAPGDALLTGKSLGEDAGYGPARLHDVKATAEFAHFLETQNVAMLQSRVNLKRMRAEQIYAMPMGPAGDSAYESELRAEVAHFFPLMRDYVVTLARKRYGLLVWLN